MIGLSTNSSTDVDYIGTPPGTHVLALDPGKVTGVAWARIGSYGLVLESVQAWEAPYPDVFQLVDYLTSKSDLCVWERYTVTGSTAKKTQAPWSWEQIGWARGCCIRNGVKIAPEQGPSDAKGLCSNNWLHERGLWVRGGAGHARDAMRHLGYFVAKTWGMSAIPLRAA